MGRLTDDFRKYSLTALGAFGDAVSTFADGLVKAKADKDTVTDGDESAETSVGGTREDTVASNPVPDDKAQKDPKSLFWDPFAIVEQLGFKDKPSNVTYGTLKAIMYRMPVVQAIVQTRVNQIGTFCRPQPDKYQLGFRIKTRETRKEPTKAERQWIEQAQVLMMRTGVTSNPRGRDDLVKFVKKLAWDMLVYDQMCFEVVPNRKGQPAEWYAVDGATMRIADTASSHFDEDEDKAVKFVQVYDGMIISEYTQDELCFAVRNPRSDLRLQGYGVSELEMLIPTITSLLYAWEFNSKFFTQGSAAKGIINFKGTIPEKELQNFRKQWYTQIASVENAWRTPITNSEDLQYINMQTSARDMEFSAWMDFQIKLACAMYAIDPAELNFKYGNTGQRNAMNESNNREKITESKERGLRPLLRHIADAFNKFIIWPINESFEFDFVGLDAQTRNDLVDLNMKRVKSFMTIDELRAEEDLPPLPDKTGEIVLDPTYMQYLQAKQQEAQQGAQGGAPGQPGAEQGGMPGPEQAGGGQPQGTQPGGTPEQGGEQAGAEQGGEHSEYEKMLQRYQAGEGGEEGEEEEGEETKRSENDSAPFAKSPVRSWVVNL